MTDCLIVIRARENVIEELSVFGSVIDVFSKVVAATLIAKSNGYTHVSRQ